MSEGYTRDHVVVIKILGREIPKRPALSTAEVCKLGFKDKGDKADRVVRNAYRKLRDKELVEICDRGMYRLTPAGAALAKQIKEKGADSLIQERKKGERKPKAKKAAKAAPKKVAKAKPAVKAKAKSKAKPAVKAKPKAAPKKDAPKTAKPAAKPANGKGALGKLRGAAPKKVETKGNAEPTKSEETKPATLPM